MEVQGSHSELERSQSVSKGRCLSGHYLAYRDVSGHRAVPVSVDFELDTQCFNTVIIDRL